MQLHNPPHRRPPAAPQSGFSLVELLLVLLIVGLASAAAVLGMPGDNASQSARAAAERFSQMAQLAVEQSILSGEIWGLVLLQPDTHLARRYQWRCWRDGEWQVNEELFGVEFLPASSSVQLTVDGEAVQWSGTADTAVSAATNAGLPLALVYPGGEATPLVLLLEPDADSATGAVLDSSQSWQKVSISSAAIVEWQSHD